MNSDPVIDLKRLENRLTTFEHWPVTFIQPTELARAGNYKKFDFQLKWQNLRFFCCFCRLLLL